MDFVEKIIAAGHRAKQYYLFRRRGVRRQHGLYTRERKGETNQILAPNGIEKDNIFWKEQNGSQKPGKEHHTLLHYGKGALKKEGRGATLKERRTNANKNSNSKKFFSLFFTRKSKENSVQKKRTLLRLKPQQRDSIDIEDTNKHDGEINDFNVENLTKLSQQTAPLVTNCTNANPQSPQQQLLTTPSISNRINESLELQTPAQAMAVEEGATAQETKEETQDIKDMLQRTYDTIYNLVKSQLGMYDQQQLETFEKELCNSGFSPRDRMIYVLRNLCSIPNLYQGIYQVLNNKQVKNESQIKALEQQIQSRDDAIQKSLRDKENLERDRRQLNMKLATTEGNLSIRDNERKDLIERVIILEEDKAQAENEARRLERELDTMKISAESHKTAADTLSLEKTKLTRQQLYMERTAEAHKQNINRQKDEIEALKDKLRKQDEQVEEYKEKIKRVEDELEASRQSQKETSEALALVTTKLARQKTKLMPNANMNTPISMELDLDPKNNVNLLQSMISEMSTLSEESMNNQRKVEEQAEEIKQLRDDHKEELLRYEQKIQQLKDNSEKQQKLSDRLRSALEEKEGILRTMEENLKKAKEEKAKDDRSSRSLEERNKQLEGQINQLKADVDNISSERAKLSEQLVKEKEAREDAEKQKIVFQEKSETLEKTNTRKDEKIKRLNEDSRWVFGNFETAKDTLRRLDEEERKLQTNPQMTGNINSERIKELEEQSQEAQRNLASARETIKTLENEASEAEKKMREMSRENEERTNRLKKILKKLKSEAEGELKKVLGMLDKYKRDTVFLANTWMTYPKWQESLTKLVEQTKGVEGAIRHLMLLIVTRARHMGISDQEINKLEEYTHNFWRGEPLMHNTYHLVYCDIFKECMSRIVKAIHCMNNSKNPKEVSFSGPPEKIAWNACLKIKKAETMWDKEHTRPAGRRGGWNPNGNNQRTMRKTGQTLITDTFSFRGLLEESQREKGRRNEEPRQTDAVFILGTPKNGKKKLGSVDEMLRPGTMQNEEGSRMQAEGNAPDLNEGNMEVEKTNEPQIQQKQKEKQKDTGKTPKEKDAPPLPPPRSTVDGQETAPETRNDEMYVEQNTPTEECAGTERRTDRPEKAAEQARPGEDAHQNKTTPRPNKEPQQEESNTEYVVPRPQGGWYAGRLRPRNRLANPPAEGQRTNSYSTTSRSSSSGGHSGSWSRKTSGSGSREYSSYSEESGRRKGKGKGKGKGKRNNSRQQKKGVHGRGNSQHQRKQDSRRRNYNNRNDEQWRKERLDAMYQKFKDFSRNIDDVVDSETQRCKYWTNSQTVGRELPRAIREDVTTAVELLSRGIYTGRGAKQREVELEWNTALLLNFPAVFLTPPKFLNDKNHYKANKAIKKALQDFINYGRLPSYEDRAPHHVTEGHSKQTGVCKPQGDMQPLSTRQQLNIEKAVMAGNVGKAARSFDPQPMADVRQEEVKEQLRRLHPQSANPQPFAGIEIPSLKEAVIDKEDVAGIVRKLPKGRAMGPAKWSYETLKYLSKSCKHFDEAIAKLAQLLSVGKFPHEAMLKEAELIAIEKAKGSYRPIAMGNSLPKLLIMLVLKARNREYEQKRGLEELRQTVRRQTGGTTTKQQRTEDVEMIDAETDGENAPTRKRSRNETSIGKGEKKGKAKSRQEEALGDKYILEETKVRKSYLGLSKEQLGVNTPCGVEAPGFIASELFKQKKLVKFFTIDISNAFNTVNRRQMALEVQNLRPDLLPLVAQLYRTPTELELADGTTITSQEGVRQGDPLSSFLYSLVTDRILRKEVEIAERYRCRVFAYLDDHSFLLDDTSDSSLTVEKVIEEIKEDLDELSLKVNTKKCYTYIPSYIQDEAILATEEGKDSDSLKRDGCKFLGSPVGDESYIQQVIDTKLKKADAVFRHLKSVKRQAAYQVVRLSLAAEAMHLYRSLGDKIERFRQWDEKLFGAVLQLSSREEEYKYIRDQHRKAISTLPSLPHPPDGDGSNMEVEGSVQASTNEVEYTVINSKTNIIQRPIKKNGKNELSIGEIKRLETEFERAKLMATLKQSNGGLGIALPRMTATPAHLGYVLDCLKLIRERDFDVALSKETIDFVQSNRDLIDAAGILIPEDWQKPQTKFYISKGSVQHPLTAEVQKQVLEGIRHRLLGWISKKKCEEEKGRPALVRDTLNTIGQLKAKRGKHKDRAYGLEQDNRGDGSSLSLSMSAFKSYFSFTNKVMAELLATKMLIPNRYGMTTCNIKKQANEVGKPHSARQLNHAYSCSNKGRRTLTHTRVAHHLSDLLAHLGYKLEEEPLLTSKGDKYYGDLYVDSLHCIIDVTGVTTSEQDASLEDAMRKRWAEKCNFYYQISRSKYFKRRYTTSVVIPFIFGPQGQIYAESQRALFERLGVLSPDISPAKREEGRNPYTSRRYLDNTISKQALSDLKFGMKQLKKHIVQYTMENAIDWCEAQAKKQKINPRKYHRFYSVLSTEDQESNTTTTITQTESSSSSSSHSASATSSSTSSSSSSSSSSSHSSTY